MANGPVFGIAKSQAVNPQIVQMLAGIGRSLAATLQAGERLRQDRQKFDEQKKQAEANAQAREENLRLQQEKFELDKQQEARLQKESESRIQARTERSARADKAQRTTDLNTRLKALNIALSATQKAAGTGAIDALNKRLAASVPLVEGPDDEHLREFEGMTPQQLASAHSRARIAFEVKAGDPLFAADNPGAVEALRFRMDATEEALNKRVQQFNVFAESSGHQVAPDPTVRANLQNLMSVELGRILGELAPEPEPTGEEAEDQATSKATLQPPGQAAGEQVGPPASAAMPAGGDLSDKFEAAHKGNDRATTAALRQQFRTLDRDSARRVFEDLSARVGEDQAEVLIFGSK